MEDRSESEAGGARELAVAEGMGTTPETPAEEPAEAISDPPRRRMSRRARGLIAGAIVAVVMVGAVVAGQMLASRSFDTAAERWADGAAALERAQDQAGTLNTTIRGEVEAAGEIATTAPADGVDTAALAAMVTAQAAAASALSASEDAAAATGPEVTTSKPFWMWDALGAAAALDRATSDVRDVVDAIHSTRQAAVDARSDMVDRAVGVFASVKSAAARIETANVSAKTGTVVALRETAATVVRLTDIATTSPADIAAYAEAVRSIEKSSKAELAEKAGPLYKKRLAVEAFARSLAGGVLIDFDWKQIVLGYGWPGSMAGETSWNSADGGTSTMLLSNSVAREWPDADSKALVAHEVGHSISAKCSSMFDWKSRKANEQWATAWAIGKGFTSDANGVQAYGHPPKALIAKSKGCR